MGWQERERQEVGEARGRQEGEKGKAAKIPSVSAYAFIFLHVYEAVSSTFMGHIAIISLKKTFKRWPRKRTSAPLLSTTSFPLPPLTPASFVCRRHPLVSSIPVVKGRRWERMPTTTAQGGADETSNKSPLARRRGTCSAVGPCLLKWWNSTGKTGKCVSFISNILL